MPQRAASESSARRLRELVEGMERSAEDILVAAHDEARQHVEAARGRADHLEQRIESLVGTAESLLAEAQAVYERLAALSTSIDRVRGELDAELEPARRIHPDEEAAAEPHEASDAQAPRVTASVLRTEPGAERATVEELGEDEWPQQRPLRVRGRFSRTDEPDQDEAEALASAPAADD